MAAVKLDLSFASPELEAEFQEAQALRSQRLEKQFHYARALTWLVVLLRALATGERWATGLVALGTASTLLPPLLERLPRAQYLRWRIPAEVADNLLQVALGCLTHHHIIYPSSPPEDPSSFQMTAVLLTGNGVAWLLLCSLWGSLPFRIALPQQAALTIILLLYNGQLCQRNAAIQLAYSALQLNTARRAHALLSWLSALPLWHRWQRAYAAGRSCAAAVLASPAQAREAVRAACMEAAEVVNAAHAERAVAAPSLDHGAQLCLRYQPASLLLLGFLLPTFFVWTAELRQRRQFLAQRAAGAAPGEASRLRLSQHHLPGLADFAMFALPAVAAIYSLVVAAS
ncbi:hypothetical protein ABPG75_009436 [Micractinium tetrahymenae]